MVLRLEPFDVVTRQSSDHRLHPLHHMPQPPVLVGRLGASLNLFAK